MDPLDSVGVRRIVETPRSAYYIVAPQYVRTSAGIRALHLLCHALNRSGERAYMVMWPFIPDLASTHPDLLTPLLSKDIIEADAARGLAPIAVYPETVVGNPLGAPFVVRYVMNFPGLLGGQTQFDPGELLFGYSSVLADAVGVPENVLFIPTSDIDVFRPEPRVPRSGTCFFAGKYRDFHRGKLMDLTRGSTEIVRDRAGSQTPAEIADLFRRSELFYCYENSALAIEAVLCECPAVFLPNEHLTSIIAAAELGAEGYAWGPGAGEVERARASVAQGRLNYLRTYASFWRQLERFVELTQSRSRAVSYATAMRHASINRPSRWEGAKRLLHSATLVQRRYGWNGVLERVGKRLVRLLGAGPTQSRW